MIMSRPAEDGDKLESYVTHAALIDETIDWSRRITRYLTGLRDAAGKPRVAMYLDDLADLQSQLTAELERYRQDAPKKVLETYTQYTSPSALSFDDVDTERLTVSEVTRIVLGLNQKLKDEFEMVATKDGPEASRRAFESLVTLIDTTNQLISRDDAAIRDL